MESLKANKDFAVVSRYEHGSVWEKYLHRQAGTPKGLNSLTCKVLWKSVPAETVPNIWQNMVDVAR